MKYALILFVAYTLLAGCVNQEKINLRGELQSLATPQQIFFIENKSLVRIKGDEGTIITIPAGALTYPNGDSVTSPVRIELREVYSKHQMVLNGLSTVSNNQLLESYGMIKINAFANDQELVIRNGKSISLSIPNKFKSVSGHLFYGDQTDTTLNWRLASKDPITIKRSTLIPTGDSINVKETVTRLDTSELLSDTSYVIPNNNPSFFIDSVTNDLAIPPYFNYEITELNWINCDEFVGLESVTNFDISLTKSEEPIGFLIFKKINSILPVYFNKTGKAMVTNVPNNESVVLLVIDKTTESFFLSTQEITISNSMPPILMTPKPISKEELATRLKDITGSAKLYSCSPYSQKTIG